MKGKPVLDGREKGLSLTTPLKLWFFSGSLRGSRPKSKSENLCFGFAEEAFTCEEQASFILSYEILGFCFIYSSDTLDCIHWFCLWSVGSHSLWFYVEVSR